MVGATMGALKKEHISGYDQVSTEEGKFELPLYTPSPEYQDRETALEEEESLLNREAIIRKKSWKSWFNLRKVVAIAVAVVFVFLAGKLILWAIGSTPNGLEGLPVFSESLGCMEGSSYLYNGGETTLSIPIGERYDHSIDISGSAVGTITVTEAPVGVDEVQYKFTIKSNDMSLLDDIQLHYPALDPGPDSTSRLLIITPRLHEDDKPSCMRFDLIMYVPKSLKKLHVSSHAPAHVKLDPEAHLDMEDTFVTLFSLNPSNMIVSTENFRSTNLFLEVYRGWIVGHASIVNKTSIATQRGDGVMNVHLHPTAPTDPENPSQFVLQTTSGAGRTDLFIENDKAFVHRPMKALHTSAMNADLYLSYQKAQFDGNIKLASSAFTATGTQTYSSGGSESGWTHWVGDMDGKDELVVKSRGWTGLYFE